jgi:ribosomal protein L37AE/L43A
MEAARPLNLLDVDSLIEEFLEEHEQGIATLHRIYFKSDSAISLRALKEEVKEELRTGCVTFVNNGSPLDELNDYLFYIVNAFCKKTSKPQQKQKAEYICPGCVFLGKEYSVLFYTKVFQCDECESELKSNSSDPKREHFFRIFHRHNKSGYRCPDCERFIPHPLDNSSAVSCPYFDCLFTGNIKELQKMHHPTSKSNPEKLILDVSKEGFCFKDNVASQEIDAQTQLEITEDLQDKVESLKEIIETQSNNTAYSSSDATVKHKQLVYQAISNLLDKFPMEMASYLLSSTDSHMGFQHKIFQEYIRLLEDSLPFMITKNRRLIKIDNLLDDNLCLFDGISTFNGVINDKLVIKNGTTEFYIGGRKATYAKPFYIGKLLNIIRQDTKTPLMQQVKDYSFSRIRMRDIEPGVSVTVTHLRVPPHYQMGGMAYVNRVRKKIVERARTLQ